jgi:hypothetical protein
MLETIAIVLIVLWLVGLVSSYTLGRLVHILLVIVRVPDRVNQGWHPGPHSVTCFCMAILASKSD